MYQTSILSQKAKNPFIAGTLILTITGLASRMIGFFYRIFLSRTFGEENIGIYQLISPVMALVFSLSAAGFQNTISKFVAGKAAIHDYKASLRILLVGFGFSFAASLLCMVTVFSFSDFLAERLLFEARCAPLLRVAALSFPFASVHSCINGYFYGVRKTAVPASSQLVEQVFRVGSVYFITVSAQKNGQEPSLLVASAGLCIGEMASMILSLLAAYAYFSRNLSRKYTATSPSHCESYAQLSCQILGFSMPLCANRLCLNILQAIEAACTPAKLQVYGYSVSESLSVYGVLTGMALPLIFFPGTITNSVSVLLMPAISEADSLNNRRVIKRAVRRCLSFCLGFGGICSFLFLCLGKYIGIFLFDSELAGNFIIILGFMCPFLYLNTTLTSILHGLGKTGYSFFLNMASLMLRLFFVFYAVPLYGIKGYLMGMLLSQLLNTLCCLLPLRQYWVPGRA